MAGKNDNFDALMAMMALKHIMDDTKDIEIHPFTCEVTVTPTSISCSWVREIPRKIFPIDIAIGLGRTANTGH